MKSDISQFFALGGLLVAGSLDLHLSAAPTTFWFGGVVTSVEDPGNAIPFPVAEGMTFTGRVTYDAAQLTTSRNTDFPGGSSAQYYFETTGGFSVQLQIGGHVISNTSAPPGAYTGEIFIENNRFDRDYLVYSVLGSGPTLIDGKPFVEAPRFSSVDLALVDPAQKALTDVKLPASAPDLGRFSELREMRWSTAIDDGGPTRVFGVTGEITQVKSEEIVVLTRTRMGPATQKLSWPVFNSGYTLQVSTNLALGNWQNATNTVTKSALEYSATVSTTGPAKYYRLRK